MTIEATIEAAPGDVSESVAVSAPAEAVEAPAAAAPEDTPAAAPVAEDAGPQAPRWAALAKRERDATLREKKLKEEIAAERAALADERKAVEEKLAAATSADDLLKLAKERPTEFFARTGLTYKDLTEAVLKEGEPPTADDRVSKLEARLEAEAKARADAEAKRAADAERAETEENERAVTAFKSSVADFVKANSETYELVAAEGAHELVFDLIAENYARTKGQIMPIEKAVELVESHLFEEASRKYKTSKKLAGMFAPAAPAPAASLPPIPVPAAKKPAPTITNKTGVAGTAPPPEKKPLLSPREIAERYRKEARARNARA